MTPDELEKLIRDRADFLRNHERPGGAVCQFNRDFIAIYDEPLLEQICDYDAGGWLRLDCVSLLGHAGSGADRKRLQRGLKQLVDAGVLHRGGRSHYRFTIAENVRG